MKEQEVESLKQILIKVENGLFLLRDGKEIPAYAKFQGVRDNIVSFINHYNQYNEDNKD